MWTNTDSNVHRIVMDDRSLDTGNIASGASSPATTLATNGGSYHCTLHPSMVGSIVAAVPTLRQKVTVFFALGLAGLGYLRLRRQHRLNTDGCPKSPSPLIVIVPSRNRNRVVNNATPRV